MVAAAVIGLLVLRVDKIPGREDALDIAISRSTGVVLLGIFGLLLFGLPLLVELWPSQALAMVDAFYRVGSLVFGGGHVVLPLLQAELVPSGWVSNDTFLAGYGAAQAVPGPLFTFAAFLGASMNATPSGWAGGILCLVAVFIPSFLLLAGVLPFWEALRHNVRTRAALAGVNAAVVGLLLAALYQPVWRNAILRPEDFALAILALMGLVFWKMPPWLVVLCSGLAGWLLSVVV
jgi:chromate transporter